MATALLIASVTMLSSMGCAVVLFARANAGSATLLERASDTLGNGSSGSRRQGFAAFDVMGRSPKPPAPL
jgi:hypothetical protein